MARGKATNGVEILDFIPTDDAPTLRDQLKQKYGENLPYTNIYLKRLDPNNNSKPPEFLDKFDNPPEMWEVKEIYGGGLYELWINWDDPSTQTGRNTYKTKFRIAGEPKKPTPADKPVMQNPIPTKKDVLDEMKMYKELLGSGGNNNDNSMILFMIQMMKSNDEKFLKMMDKLNTHNDSGTDKTLIATLLQAALQKTTGDLDMFDKVSSIIERFSGSGGEKNEYLELAKGVLPALLNRGAPQQVLAGPGPGVNGSPQARLNPPGGAVQGSNELTVLLNKVIETNNYLVNKVAELEKKQYYSNLSEDEIEEFKADYTALGHAEHFSRCISSGKCRDNEDYNCWCIEAEIPQYAANVTELNQKNNMSIIANTIKTAGPEIKRQLLIQYINSDGYEKTFDWLFKEGVIDNSSAENGLIEFNQWCRDFGILEYKPQSV